MSSQTSISLSLRVMGFVLAVAPATMLVSAAHAQETTPPAPGMSFEIGAGIRYEPSYESSSRYVFDPFPLVDFDYIRFPNGFQLGGGDSDGFSIQPSFDYKRKRSAEDDSVLTGLPNVDTSIELGATVGYEFDHVRVSLTGRYGVTGHNGFVGEAGIDIDVSPDDRFTVVAGPRLTFADSDYMNTYFGVSAASAASSSFSAFDPSGGIKSAGFEVDTRYALTEKWAARGIFKWEHLLGDAADSPITAVGDKNQFSIGIGLTRQFTIDF